MTYVGAPMIYYGDEAGMWGGHDPDCRKPMLWKEWVYENETYKSVRPDLTNADENKFDSDLFQHYKKLIRIRKENPAIQRGTFSTKLVDDEKGLYGYLRKYDSYEVMVILNNSDKNQTTKVSALWENNAKVTDQLNEAHYQVKEGAIALTIGKKWGAILVKK
jgi:glycosidase